MRVYLATDHAGFELKNKVKTFLQKEGYDVEDCGAFSYDKNDDYPDFIKLAAEKVSQNPDDRAVIFGGSGQGEAIVANKFTGVRCALFYTPCVPPGATDASGKTSDDPFEMLRLTREHNNSNILSLGSRFLTDEQAFKAVKTWLETLFTNEERHMRRIEKIARLESWNPNVSEFLVRMHPNISLGFMEEFGIIRSNHSDQLGFSMPMLEIIPGILEKEWSEIEKKIEIAKRFSRVMHIDLLDGKFAENTTFQDPAPFKKYSNDIFFELHMMVDNPLAFVKPWAAAGIRRFLGHIEKMPDQVAFVATTEQYGEVGLAIDGPTPLDALKTPLIDLDAVLIMTIKAGFSGQSFMPELLEKVKKLRKQSGSIPIQIDGGVNDQTILQAKNAGVTRCVATSFLFKSSNPQEQYQLLQKI